LVEIVYSRRKKSGKTGFASMLAIYIACFHAAHMRSPDASRMITNNPRHVFHEPPLELFRHRRCCDAWPR
jgi:hypothetical protein